jgi:hypothetical protein
MPVVVSVAAVLVGTLYLVWRAYRLACLRREQRIRRRVAYMLWAMAEQDESRPSVTLSGLYRVGSN